MAGQRARPVPRSHCTTIRRSQPLQRPGVRTIESPNLPNLSSLTPGRSFQLHRRLSTAASLCENEKWNTQSTRKRHVDWIVGDAAAKSQFARGARFVQPRCGRRRRRRRRERNRGAAEPEGSPSRRLQRRLAGRPAGAASREHAAARAVRLPAVASASASSIAAGATPSSAGRGGCAGCPSRQPRACRRCSSARTPRRPAARRSARRSSTTSTACSSCSLASRRQRSSWRLRARWPSSR